MKTLYRDRIAQAVFETLEGRRLMSSVTLSGGELLVQPDGTEAAMKVSVTTGDDGGKLRVTGAGGDGAQVFGVEAVQSIRILGTSGDDVIQVGPAVAVPATIQAGPGDDKVFGGGAADLIDGQEGADTIQGRGGDDTLAGGDGDDRLFGGAGADAILGQAGGDKLDGGEGENLLVAVDATDYGSDAVQARKDFDPGEGELPPLPPPAPAPGPVPSPDPAPAPQPAPQPEPERAPTPAPSPSPDSNGDGDGDDDDGNAAPTPPIDVDNDAPSPTAEITFTTDASGMAGHTVHAHALGGKLGTGDALGARYEWDFGDPGARFKRLAGWNAAHTYDTPGTYAVTLTVTNASGKRDVATRTVTIKPDARRSIYVDAAKGSDSNDGRSQGEAFRTVEAAANRLGDDTELLVRNGQTHDVKGTIKIDDRNVVLGTYGPGPKARVRRVQQSGESAMFKIENSAENFRAQGIEFDSVWGLDSSYGRKKVPARAFTVGGSNVTIRDNVFRNLTDGVNTENEPTGVLVQDNLFTAEIRGYGIWSEGFDHVYLGNTMRDSKQEHLIRAHQSGVERVLIAHNDLTRASQAKGSIELRHAKWFYVAQNKMTGGTLRAGLATEGDKENDPTWKSDLTHWGVFEANVTERLFINVRPGVQHLAIRNNVVTVDDWEPVLDNNAILIQQDAPGYDYVRQTDDIRVEYNTVINNDDSAGHFLRVNGSATNLTVSHNLYVAPRLTGDGDDEGGLFVNAEGLSGFDEIEGNVWPKTDGALNYVSGAGFMSPKAWNAQLKVDGDVYADVTLGNGTYSVTVAGVYAGSGV